MWTVFLYYFSQFEVIDFQQNVETPGGVFRIIICELWYSAPKPINLLLGIK